MIQKKTFNPQSISQKLSIQSTEEIEFHINNIINYIVSRVNDLDQLSRSKDIDGVRLAIGDLKRNSNYLGDQELFQITHSVLSDLDGGSTQNISNQVANIKENTLDLIQAVENWKKAS